MCLQWADVQGSQKFNKDKFSLARLLTSEKRLILSNNCKISILNKCFKINSDHIALLKTLSTGLLLLLVFYSGFSCVYFLGSLEVSVTRTACCYSQYDTWYPVKIQLILVESMILSIKFSNSICMSPKNS